MTYKLKFQLLGEKGEFSENTKPQNLPIPMVDFHGNQVVNHRLGVFLEASNKHTERHNIKSSRKGQI